MVFCSFRNESSDKVFRTSRKAEASDKQGIAIFDVLNSLCSTRVDLTVKTSNSLSYHKLINYKLHKISLSVLTFYFFPEVNGAESFLHLSKT